VAWAGEAQSDNRFDTAREYTERWHHQMQIGTAVGVRGRPDVLLAPKYLMPLLDTPVRGLPHAYRALSAPDGTSVVLRVAGDSPCGWTLRRQHGGRRLYSGMATQPDARVTGDPEVVWHLFFDALPESAVPPTLSLDGPRQLVAPLLQARSVMV
jgi:hypothetical protein